MNKYTDEELAEDEQRVLMAYDQLVELQEQYKDVIAIPEVVSIRDIADYRIATDCGIKQFKEIYGRDVAEKVLHIIRLKNFVTPAVVETAIVEMLHNHEDIQ